MRRTIAVVAFLIVAGGVVWWLMRESTAPGPAVVACVTDMGTRFRMVAAEVDVVPAPAPLPKLPVARAVWRPRPDLRTSAAAWIHAGGSHHTSLGFSVTRDHLRDLASMTGVELLMIGADTKLDAFRDQVRCNDLYWLLAKGL